MYYKILTIKNCIVLLPTNLAYRVVGLSQFAFARLYDDLILSTRLIFV